MADATTTAKKALRGLKAFNVFPITTNTAAAYETGTLVNLIGAQRLTKSVQENEVVIYADDEVYDSDNEFKYIDLQLQVTEMSLENLASLTGGTWDDTDKIASSSTTDVAPEYALAYAALYKGGYRLFKHPVAKLMSVSVDHESKGDTAAIAPYTLNFRVFARKIDNKHTEQMDVLLSEVTGGATAFDWIGTFDTLPPKT